MKEAYHITFLLMLNTQTHDMSKQTHLEQRTGLGVDKANELASESKG